MTSLCTTVGNFAGLFLLLAAIAALAETAVLVMTKLRVLKKEAPSAQGGTKAESLAPELEGLAKVLNALKELPAWVALFLAGLALIWTASAAPKLCPCPNTNVCKQVPAGK
jgi:hypothetical protein